MVPTLGGMGVQCWQDRPGRPPTACSGAVPGPAGPAPPAQFPRAQRTPRSLRGAILRRAVCAPRGAGPVVTSSPRPATGHRGRAATFPAMPVLRTAGAASRWSTTAGAVLVLAGVVAGCSSTAPTASTSSSTRPPPTEAGLPPVAPPQPITWTTCPTAATLQCGTVPVPLDYRHPSAGTLSIAVTRSPATGGSASGGTLFVNPGGPGESGNQILPVLLPLLPPDVRAVSDVVGFDPRGTGASAPLRSPPVPACRCPAPRSSPPWPGPAPPPTRS